MQGNRLTHPDHPQFAASLGRKDGLILITRHPHGAVQKGLKFRRHDHPGGRRGRERGCAHVTVELSRKRPEPPQGGPVRLAVRRNPCSRASAVSGARLKARRRGGLMLLTMSTPAPALVITTPTEVGGAVSMVSEAARDRGVASVPRRRAGALYPQLRPGPHPSARESVASNQRARLYGAMIELVAARGYEASTVAELCALAGVSKRTLYERFQGGKQQCFLATYEIIVRRAEMHILGAGAVCAGRDRGRRPAGAAARPDGGGVRARGGGISQRRAARAGGSARCRAGSACARQAHETTGRTSDLVEPPSGLRGGRAPAAHGQADRGGWHAARPRTLVRRSHLGAR